MEAWMDADWTVLFDNMLVERWRTCWVCGLERAERLDFREVAGRAVTIARCRACYERDKAGTQLDARLARRFG
jgi:hypothetical protein